LVKNQQVPEEIEETGMFGLMDTNKNGKLDLFEFYEPFSLADLDRNIKVTPDEFIWWFQLNQPQICHDYAHFWDLTNDDLGVNSDDAQDLSS
jgi:hypothetical protein